MDDAFHPTRWTLVLRSRGESGAARAALSELCAAYYAPVISYLQREGRDEDAAREMAHAFFEEMLSDGVGRPDKNLGKFRSYLLGALKHFISRRRAADSAQKRGGGWKRIPFVSSTETTPGFPLPAAREPTPELLFDRDWALTLIARALAALEVEHAHRPAFFQSLKPWLDGNVHPALGQAETAQQLGLSGTALKVAIHRLRLRFRELLRQEVTATVHDPADTAGELRHLISIMSA
jgi:DNA-directed RNA polymerase specialized sigma24 family protein